MSALRRFVDKIKPPFEKGGKLHIFLAGFEAVETFLFVPNKVTTGKVHIKDSNDMKRSLIIVMIAMVPALLFGIWNTGNLHFQAMGVCAGFWRIVGFGVLKILPLYIVSYVVGLGIEIGFAQWRHEEVAEGYFVTGFLIPLVMPVDVPLWMVAVATVFAVVIGKEVFGGTGMNILNPALVARAFLFFAYPGSMSGDKVWIAGLTDGTGVIGDRRLLGINDPGTGCPEYLPFCERTGSGLHAHGHVHGFHSGFHRGDLHTGHPDRCGDPDPYRRGKLEDHLFHICRRGGHGTDTEPVCGK